MANKQLAIQVTSFKGYSPQEMHIARIKVWLRMKNSFRKVKMLSEVDPAAKPGNADYVYLM